MGKGLRVHLRLNETDRDLCRWRHSIRCNMLTSYVSQILKAEACGEIAVLPVFDKISADDTPCDVYMLIDDTDIIEFITSIPVYRRNSKIKKHYPQAPALSNDRKRRSAFRLCRACRQVKTESK